MVLESTIICFDNSEDTRSGDFSPSRLHAEQDGASLLIQCKLKSNPENNVGILTMAPRVNILSSLTSENGKLFIKLQQVKPDGTAQFLTALKIAQLALKNRQSRVHKCRIVIFVGSLMEEDEEELINTAKKFKKEKVNVDIVCFGNEASTNEKKLKMFLETLNGKDTGSRMIVVPSGSSLQQALMKSDIVRGPDGGAAPIAGQDGGFFDVDPNEDPELAMAMRASMEEQRARQEQQIAAATAASAAEQQATATGGGETAQSAPASPSGQQTTEQMTEDEQLAMALRMSMEVKQPEGRPVDSVGGKASEEKPKEGKIRPKKTAGGKASPPKMSGKVAPKMPNVEPEPSDAGEQSAEDDMEALMADPTVLQALIRNLPGIDAKSPAVQQALAQVAAEGSKKSGNAKAKAKDEKDEK